MSIEFAFVTGDFKSCDRCVLLILLYRSLFVFAVMFVNHMEAEDIR